MNHVVLKKVKDFEDESFEQKEIVGAGWILPYPSKNDTKEYREFKRIFKDVLNLDALVAKKFNNGKKVCLYV